MLLKFLRKRQNMRRIMWAIAILIIPAFIIWGVGTQRKGPRYAGRIFNRKVSFEEYKKVWYAIRYFYQIGYGENIPEDFLYDIVWNRLILLDEARRQKIKISDKEVIEKIVGFPTFQKNGRFDKGLYKTMLQDNARIFEENIKDDLAISKLKNKIISRITLTEEGLKLEYKKENEKIKLSYILIKPKDFEGQVTYAEDELKSHYEQNIENFKTEEMVNVEYIGFDYNGFENQVNIQDQEILEYFDKHKEEFKKLDTEGPQLEEGVKKTIKMRLLNKKTRQLAEENIYRFAKELRKENFDEVIKKNSLIKTETGFFSRNQPIPNIGFSYQFTKTDFDLKNGEISAPIQTDKGYYILRIKERKAPYIPSFEETKERVRQNLINEKSWETANKKATQLYSQIKEQLIQGKDSKDILDELKIEIKETEFITRNSYIPGIGPGGEFTNLGFSLEAGEWGGPVKTNAGLCIVRLDEFQSIDEKKFEEEKEDFKQKKLMLKKEEVFDRWFEELKKKAQLISFIELG